MNLLYYQVEAVRFRDAYQEVLSNSVASLFFLKLQKHYGFHQVLQFRRNNQGGNCSRVRVRLSNSPSLGLLAHEVAHAIQFKKVISGEMKNTKRWHTKKHTAIMKRVIDYVNSNKVDWLAVNYKKIERNMLSNQRRFEKKRAVAEYRKSDEYKLGLLSASEKRLTTKAKRINTLLGKVRRKIKYYSSKGKVFK